MKYIIKFDNDYGSGGRKAWYRTVTGINPDEKGARHYIGQYIEPGHDICLEEGTLVIGVHPEGVKSNGTDAAKLYRIGAGGAVETIAEGYSWKRDFHTFSALVSAELSKGQPDKADQVDECGKAEAASDLDLTQVPDELLIAELARRLKRGVHNEG